MRHVVPHFLRPHGARFLPRLVGAACVLLLACTVDRSGLGTDLGLDSTVDFGPDAPPPDLGNPCTVPGTRFCRMGTLYECMGSVATEVEVCDHGCSTAGARCAIMDVANLNDSNDALLTAGSLDLVVANGEIVAFDTDTGAVARDGVTIRNGGQGLIAGIHHTTQGQPAGGFNVIGVFAIRSLQVDAGGLLIANGARPFALLVATTVVVDGTIDVGGGDRETATSSEIFGPAGGVGGIAGGAGGGPGGAANGAAGGAANGGGGGGGGHGVMGASGGDQSPTTMIGGQGGAPIANSSGTPLAGGGGGGGGAIGVSGTGGRGGGGGGAIQLVAGMSITVDGVIRSPGSGGLRTVETQGAGGGGGAGGMIVLQSESIVLTPGSAVTANGGGGGGADAAGAALAQIGERGTDTATAAMGGAGTSTGGAGGNGGFGLAPGGMTGVSNTGGGGGGGAAGRLHFVSDSRTTNGATISPGFTTGTLAYE